MREPKTYMPIVMGKGLRACGYVRDFYPGENRSLQRGERNLGEFATWQEAFDILWRRFKHVSAGLKGTKKKRGQRRPY